MLPVRRYDFPDFSPRHANDAFAEFDTERADFEFCPANSEDGSLHVASGPEDDHNAVPGFQILGPLGKGLCPIRGRSLLYRALDGAFSGESFGGGFSARLASRGTG